MCTDDGTITPAWQRKADRELPGVEPIELPGGHCPHVSRPEVLADALVRPEPARNARSEQKQGLSLPRRGECVGLPRLNRDLLFSWGEIQSVRFQNHGHDVRTR